VRRIDPSNVAQIRPNKINFLYLSGILSSETVGVICVVENTLGQAFTYRIDGKDATFLGLEDLHDPRYDKKELKVDYSSFVNNDRAGYGRYTGVPVNNERISYTIRVYPSREMEVVYLTNMVSVARDTTKNCIYSHFFSLHSYLAWICLNFQPIIYACAILFVFVFTTAIFVLYDRYVARRQRIVSSAAEKSNAVVSSMFPKAVRDRLMNEKEQRLASNSATEEMSKTYIADFFPEATIMFADIQGFTAWCSERVSSRVEDALELPYKIGGEA